MIKAEHPNGAKFQLDGEELVFPKEFEFIKTAFDAFRPLTSEGEPEALFYYTFLEPIGFVLTEYKPAPEEPETDY